MIIHPYKLGSRSAAAIRNTIREKGGKAWTLQKQPKNPRSLVINWGASTFQFTTNAMVLVNDPFDTHRMSNKVEFFNATGHSKDVLEWTTARDTALSWKACTFARTLTQASGGRGIVVHDPETDDADALPQAPLYTRYVPKTHEYRLHLARALRGKGFTVMLAQRKVFRKTPERPVPTDWKVRSHDNGFIFQSHPTFEKIPSVVMEAAGRVMSDHFPNLHFAALDVMYHDKRDQAWVIEGNTAPGLENDSIRLYAEYFMALEKEHKQCMLKN